MGVNRRDGAEIIRYVKKFPPSSEQRFQSFEDVEKWVKEWIKSENEASYRYDVCPLPKRWGKVVVNDGQYFD
ncbi:hypothetical protein ANCDUO_20050 [Ancylostoma duodenale]|uniref:Uncharacterized protein n=1 Tax=Ancylostoma duodenale TaxID=51022 RepID=A0A0C2FT81_9BILA|nr:hypothetical protein ANCDUO_20050 [Ancylostoma duodenale]